MYFLQWDILKTKLTEQNNICEEKVVNYLLLVVNSKHLTKKHTNINFVLNIKFYI